MNILIIHTAFIGDIVLSTPLLKRIKEVYKEAKITYVTTPAGASILKNNPYITEIIEYDKRGRHKGIRGIIELGKRLRYGNFSLAIVPHRYLRSSILAWLSRAPKRIGYNIASGSILYTDRIKYDKSKHEVEKLLSFLGKVDGDLKEKYPLELYPGMDENKKIDEIFKDLKEKKIITIAPGSKWETKRWPIEYFNVLLEKLRENEKESQVIIVGGNEEKSLKLDLKNEIDLRGKTTLLELAELLKRSDVVVTNDSSPIHIASAFKKPYIVAIFGPTIEKFGFFPWSKNSVVLEEKEIECRPCGIHGGNSCPKKHFKCMKNILPNRVYDEIKKGLLK